MKKIWMSTVAIFCTLIFMCFQSYAEGCRPITTWSSSDTASFTSNQATVYDYINTSYPIPNLGGALVTSVTINLTNGPGIRIWSHEDDLAAVATLANYLASTTWRSANSHYYDEYYLIYKVDAKGMVKTLDLIANYRGNLVEILSYFFGERPLSGELPIYASWFSQVKALIDAKCSGSCGAGKIPLPEGVLAFDIRSEMASSPISGCDPETIRPLAW
jgi:hypothetical protein